MVRGERTTAYVSFSGNAQPDGFLVRVIGTRMRVVEANLYEPPRLIVKRSRSGEPALGTLIDGISESRQVLVGSIAGFLRKLGGTKQLRRPEGYDLRTYRHNRIARPQPISLDEMDEGRATC